VSLSNGLSKRSPEKEFPVEAALQGQFGVPNL
jgi:hypothetical protein